MTLKEAKECVHFKYPRAVAIYSGKHNGFFIHETRYTLSRIIGPKTASATSTIAWKDVAKAVFDGTD